MLDTKASLINSKKKKSECELPTMSPTLERSENNKKEELVSIGSIRNCNNQTASIDYPPKTITVATWVTITNPNY